VNVSDAVYLLEYLFLAGATPPAPFPECASEEPPSELDCEVESCPP